MTEQRKRLLITGSRHWQKEASAKQYVNALVARAKEKNYLIVVGDAAGVDEWVWRAAIKQNYRGALAVYGITPQPRNGWPGTYLNTGIGPNGEFALTGFLHRDRYMVTLADICMAVWNGQSRGTKYTYDRACKAGIEAYIAQP